MHTSMCARAKRLTICHAYVHNVLIGPFNHLVFAALARSVDHLPTVKPGSNAVDTLAAAEVHEPAVVVGRSAAPAMQPAHSATAEPPTDTVIEKAAPELAHAVPAPAAQPMADPAAAHAPGPADMPVETERGSEVRASRLFGGSGLAANDVGKLPPINSSLGGCTTAVGVACCSAL
eukprot:355943-Chlamydomonas_euryale.AAC.10